jgi:hypothetical protein
VVASRYTVYPDAFSVKQWVKLFDLDLSVFELHVPPVTVGTVEN